MAEIVLDASVLIKWLRTEQEDRVEGALALRRDFEAGGLIVVVPPLLPFELLNVARHWGFDQTRLVQLARTVGNYGFIIHQPDLENVARWTARGLTAYDACYVALAEERRTAVVTADRQMLALAPGVAVPLA